MILYAIPVIILQLLFWDVDSDTAGRVLPLLFAVSGLSVAWYLAHLWNREVILYERGFTYTEGSRIGHFLYGDIIQMHQKVERIAYLDLFHRRHYAYTLRSNEDETLHINNIYSDLSRLIKRLEGFITRDRLIIIEAQIAAGQAVALGGGLLVSQAGLEFEGRGLFWHEIGERRIKNNRLSLAKTDGENWLTLPIRDLDNIILTLGIIKKRLANKPVQTAPETDYERT